jgi:hypothetical protein
MAHRKPPTMDTASREVVQKAERHISLLADRILANLTLKQKIAEAKEH